MEVSLFPFSYFCDMCVPGFLFFSFIYLLPQDKEYLLSSFLNLFSLRQEFH